MYSFDRVQREFIKACTDAGVRVNAPILLNTRLSKTLGRVTQTYDSLEGRYYPSKVEFSKKFIETSTDKSIRDVILHEAAHYIVTYRTGESHGHDTCFKQVCAEIGTNNDKASTKVERTVASEALYKYTITCMECGHKSYASRMSKNLRAIDRCGCAACHTWGKLVLKQNY